MPTEHPLHARLRAFMDEEVYPAEQVFEAQVAEDPWRPPPILDALKAKARSLGLWNLFLPGPEHGAGLTTLEYAPLCELMGRSFIAPETCNCSAPDSGNMEVLARYGMPLALYTNASALTGDKIETLRRSGVLRTMVVNLPSDDPAEFADLTGSASYAHSTRNVEAALAAGLPVQIGVNGVGERLALNLDGVARRYLPLGAQVTANLMCDRAGDVGGEFAQNLLIDGPLTGCGYPVHHASFSVGGDLFLCCNDYYQRERFANIGEGSIHELMTSDAAVTARRKVFGVAVAEDDFVCRRCHNQTLDFACRDFRPIATFG